MVVTVSAQAGNGKPVRAGPWGDRFDRLTAAPMVSRFGTEARRKLPLFRFHPCHHLSLRGVELSLPPLARFLEVLMTS